LLLDGSATITMPNSIGTVPFFPKFYRDTSPWVIQALTEKLAVIIAKKNRLIYFPD